MFVTRLDRLDVRNSKRSVEMTRSGRNGLNIRTNVVPNGTRPGVRRSKRPLFLIIIDEITKSTIELSEGRF